jgi:hypothetical protein
MEVHAPPPQVMHVQAPFAHVCPWGHALPQPPQFLSSATVSRQLPPQQPGITPEHAFEHEPQLWMSSVTNAPWQQSCPAPHFTPQAPQLLQSREKSAHVPEQQAGAALPQTYPQLPQLLTSFWKVAGSTNLPPQQARPVGHVTPQAPQLAQLVERSAHTPSQHSGGKPCRQL